MASTGNKGRFSERIKNILRSMRGRKQKKKNNADLKDSKEIYYNFLKVAAAIPGFVQGAMKDENKLSNNSAAFKEKKEVHIYKRTLVEKIDVDALKKNRVNIFNRQLLRGRELKRSNQPPIIQIPKSLNQVDIDTEKHISNNKITDNSIQNASASMRNVKDENVSLNKVSDNHIFNDNLTVFPMPADNVTEKDNTHVKALEKSIINLIKKDLIRIVNEMEILQSELYILNEVNGDDIVLKECQKKLDEVKSIICKIDKLKEKYDFLKDNYDFEYLLEIGDDILVDKIIELKNVVGNNEIKALAEDYKLLDAYKYLYLKLDEFKDKTINFEEKKQEEVEKLKKRDIDFEKLKHDVYNVDTANKNYDHFVASQNEILKEIDENMHKITSYQQVEYHLRGFGELFRNGFKYFGLLMVSPLKGIIPSIATETIITGNLIKNLYKNLKWEESTRTVYETIDYQHQISGAIDDLNNISGIVDATLEDIVRLKMEYNDKFKKYHGDFLEYRDIMHKIDDMENKIFGNKIKIEMMKKRALEQSQENVKKLVLVKDLNRKGNQTT